MRSGFKVLALALSLLVTASLVSMGHAASAGVVGEAITFSELPIGTAVTDQYQSWGVRFGGDQPFVTTDGSNPTSPVLSGTPKFEGDLEITLVEPLSGASATSNGLSLDVGYINNRDSVEIVAYGLDGTKISSQRTNAYGINNVKVQVAGLHRVTVSAVMYEDAGFAIDNVRVLNEVAGKTPVSMASLGDSYSSGEGLVVGDGLTYDCGTNMDKTKYIENTTAYSAYAGFAGIGWTRTWPRGACDTLTGTSVKPADYNSRPVVTHHNKCHRAGSAYPNSIREQLKISADRSLFVACSGAVTENIGLVEKDNWAQFYKNSPNRVAGGNLQAEDLKNFRNDLGAAPDLITIGIGGNDIGFVDIVNACSFKDCLKNSTDTADIITRLTTEVYPKLKATFTKIREDFAPGGSTIAAFGYPSVVGSATPGCRDLPFLFDQDERAWLNNTLLPSLNETISDAAKTAGITFIDITAATTGRELCTDQAAGVTPAINGVNLLAGDGRLVAAESLHPTPAGHELITSFFMKHYTDGGRLLFSNPDPQPAIDPPAGPVANFRIGSVDASVGANCGTQCLQPQACDASCLLHLDGNGFEAGGSLKVVVHSEPLDLGTVTVGDDGRFEADIAIPAGLEPGDHYVELTGQLKGGGEQVAYYPFRVEAPFAQPVAKSQALTTDKGAALAVVLDGTSDDRLNRVFSVTENPGGGTLSGDAPNLTYTPNANFTGEDTLQFVLNDGVHISEPARISVKVGAGGVIVSPSEPKADTSPPPATSDPTPPAAAPAVKVDDPEPVEPVDPPSAQVLPTSSINTAGEGRLAFTGGTATSVLIVGVLLVVLGSGVIVLRRRVS